MALAATAAGVAGGRIKRKRRTLSRRHSRPAIWSISAPVSTTPSIGLPRRLPRMQRRRRLDLRAQIRRGVDATSSAASPRRRDSPGCGAGRANPGPRQAGKRGSGSSIAESRRRPPPEHDGGQAPHLAGLERRRRKSELGRQIAVDLEADANLDKNWGRPSHGVSFRPHSTGLDPHYRSPGPPQGAPCS